MNFVVAIILTVFLIAVGHGIAELAGWKYEDVMICLLTYLLCRLAFLVTTALAAIRKALEKEATND